jgi:HK97 family phage major capsid protein
VPAARQYIDNRLGYMVKQRLDGQILNGDGTAPNIAGITDDSRTGLQTQAKRRRRRPGRVYNAMTKIRVNAFSEPNAVVFHPNDWQDFRLLRTADGIYIWGNPADAGPERIWGLRVVQTVAETEKAPRSSATSTRRRCCSGRG